MASKRKSVSKFMSEDINELVNNSQFKHSLQSKMLPHEEPFEEESRIKTEQIPNKKRRESYFEVTQKAFNVIDEQIEKRKKSDKILLTSLSDILSELKADDDVMTENEQKLEQLVGAFTKSIQQSTLARKQKLKKLQEIQSMYKTVFEEMYVEEKSQNKQITRQLNDDINKLQEKLIADANRNVYETMRKTIFHAMQNGFSI